MLKTIDDSPGFSDLSLGGKQLVRTYAYNKKNEGKDPRKSVEEDVIPYVSWIEKMEKGKMTCGIDISLPFEVEGKVLRTVNELAGTSAMKPSEVKTDVTELRLSPSYSQIVTYLIDELWKAEIIPVDHAINYGLNLCKNSIKERSFLLAIANVAHGLTLELSKNGREIEEVIPKGTLVQPMLQITQGRDIYTGKVIPIDRMNLYVGIAARFQKVEPKNHDWTDILADDFRTRIEMTRGLENLPTQLIEKCERELYNACGSSEKDINTLRKKWRRMIEERNVVDLIKLISEDDIERVKKIVGVYQKEGLAEIRKGHRIGDLPEEKTKMPASVEKGVDWMICLAFDNEPTTAEIGVEMLKEAGGRKAESILEIIKRSKN